MRNLVCFSLAAIASAANAQPIVEAYAKTVDLRSLVPNGVYSRAYAVHLSPNGTPNLTATVTSMEGPENAYNIPIGPTGDLGTPVQLNPEGEHSPYFDSFSDARGNFYFVAHGHAFWKFSGLYGSRVGTIPIPKHTQGYTMNSLGNFFTSVAHVNMSGGSGTNLQYMKRYSTGMVQNFSYIENGNRVFNRVVVDSSDNVWFVGNTFTWIEGFYRTTGIVLRKYSPNMNLLFDVTHPVGGSRNYSLTTDDSGNLLVTSDEPNLPALRKFSPSGSMLWSRALPGSPIVRPDRRKNLIIADEEGRITLALSRWLVQYSANGGLIRSTVLPGSLSSRDLVRDAHSFYYVLGEEEGRLGRRLHTNIMKFDSSAKMLYSVETTGDIEDSSPQSLTIDSKTGDIYTAGIQMGEGTAVSLLQKHTQRPEGRPDTLNVASGVKTSLPVFANDRYVGNFPYQFVIATPPQHGQIIPGSSIYYKSNPGYTGPDEFYYRVIRNGLDSFKVKVTLNVQ